MSALIVLDVRVTDLEAYEEYKTHSTRVLAQYGGKFIARGGSTEVLEGEWNPNRIVILEFETMERAREWYHSPEYAAPMQLRQRASQGNMILVEGT